MSPITADVRQFLTDHFSDEEFTTLCFDFFPEAHSSFASGMSKGQKIQLLIEYVKSREQLPDLLQALQQQRPAQYVKRFGQAEATPVTQPRPASPAPAQSASTVNGGVNLEGQQVSVGHDVVGRDKIVQAGTYIEHATIVQSAPSIQDAKAAAQPERKANAQTWGGMEFVRIPAGKFLMGSKDDNVLAYDNEKPQHSVEIPYDYWLARYPVMNEQFALFIDTTNYVTTAEKDGGWSIRDGKFVNGIDWRHPLEPKKELRGKGDHPVVQVSWHDAMAYCRWLNTLARTDLPSQELVIRLSSEAEWEKAARGEYGNEWPWGNEFDQNKCNSKEGNEDGTTPAGAYSPQGDSPYGAADMAGNVWEWCHSLYQPYPYKVDDGRENETAVQPRVLRGGSFRGNRRDVCCAYRINDSPDSRRGSHGFRVVVSPRFQLNVKWRS